MRRNQFPIVGTFVFLIFWVITPCHLSAEIVTITATGEYQMTENDTRAQAKRLALLEAKRLALKQVVALVESISEIKGMGLTKDEIRIYTAGLIQIVEHNVRTKLEGQQQVLVVDVEAKIDTASAVIQMNSLRRDEQARAELKRIDDGAERLRQELEATTKEVASLKSAGNIDSVKEKRDRQLNKMDAQELLARAWTTLTKLGSNDTVSSSDLAEPKKLIEDALLLDPTNADAHFQGGVVLEKEGKYEAAAREFTEAVRLDPYHSNAHISLAQNLGQRGDYAGATAHALQAI